MASGEIYRGRETFQTFFQSFERICLSSRGEISSKGVVNSFSI